MNQVNKVTGRKSVKIVKTFTNGFAQKVYILEDGTYLFVDYPETEITIETTEPIESQRELADYINSLPEEN